MIGNISLKGAGNKRNAQKESFRKAWMNLL